LVALKDGKVVAYLLFDYKDDFYRGRHIVVDYHSFASSSEVHPRLLRHLYAEAGRDWVKNGYFTHLIFAPLGQQEIVFQWLDQSFAFNQKYAVLPFDEYVKNNAPSKLSFRKATTGDEELLRGMAGWNSFHQANAPSWNPVTNEIFEGLKEGYSELPADDEAITYLTEKDGKAVGFQVYYRTGIGSALTGPANCVELSASAVHPDMRGAGIGKAMTDYCFRELMELGYEHCYLDWHSPNILASQFWPNLGFKPFMARMVRKVDERISWANGE